MSSNTSNGRQTSTEENPVEASEPAARAEAAAEKEPVAADATDGDVAADEESLAAVDDDDEVAVEVEAADEADPSAARIAELEAEVADLGDKNKQTYERLLRATADLDNFRKRARRDVADARTDSKSKVLMEMLPVVDNLERAVAHARGGDGDQSGIIEGVELVLRQFQQSLERCDVRPVTAMEQPFDPNFHEAVGQKESADHPAGTVVEELQRGYMIGDRLLRPALVVVSKAPAEPVAAEPEAAEPEAAEPEAASADADEGPAASESEAPEASPGDDDEVAATEKE